MNYTTILGQFSKTLQNLHTILNKMPEYAASKKFDVDVLLTARLAPDQFHFIRQVQIACDTAKLCASRLSGKDAPVHEDTEKTIPELLARIESVTAYLASFKEEDFKGASERKISQPRWEGKYVFGDEFLTQHAIPNVFFHVTTAYAILRHNGMSIGKKDYLGAMPFKS